MANEIITLNPLTGRAESSSTIPPAVNASLRSFLASNQTNATATLAASNLSIAVEAGKKYDFRALLFVENSQAAEGVKIDFGGGTATMTLFLGQAKGFDVGFAINQNLVSLTTQARVDVFTGAGAIEVEGSMQVNQGGTFVIRFAENTHVSGTLTLKAGSRLIASEI